MWHSWIIAKGLLVSFLASSSAFTSVQNHRIGSPSYDACTTGRRRVTSNPLLESPTINHVGEDTTSDPDSKIKSNSLIEKVSDLVDGCQVEEAARLLIEFARNTENVLMEERLYQVVLQSLSDARTEGAPDLADALLQSLLEQERLPSSEVYNLVIAIWSKSTRKEASKKCVRYLQDLWSQYEESGDEKFVPMRSSYISTITSLSRSNRRPGSENAEKAEDLLEEMEERRHQFPQLAPNTLAVNAVLNAWSKSRIWNGPAGRCEQILDRMIKLSKERPDIGPDTTSFNTVIDTLAKSKERDREQRAEALLEKMQELSSNDRSLKCQPDHVSFNAVINCWAQSSFKGAARRATAILKHMTKRYEAKSSNVPPDSATYTTAINAWARSKEPDAVDRAEEILAWCEESYAQGNTLAKPNALTYNSLINCYSKSNLANAADKAMGVLELMKEKSKMEGFEDCRPDVVTYTSVIDALAKQKSVEAGEKAVSMLNELERAYEASHGNELVKPNVRTYTSTINAIGRSGKNPDKAAAILKRIEVLAREGDKAVTPDVVCYNAVINAYGWSDQPGRALKCYSILQHMVQQFNSGENMMARPDIITCNSVLNACAFDEPKTDSEREDIIKVMVDTLEMFQKQMPKFGYPDHATFAQVLLAIARQMPPGDKRYEMAEAAFWQCCRAGHVSVLVVSSLEQALSWSRFASVMGSALQSKEGEKTAYDLKLFPRSWTKHAPRKGTDGKSQGSRKRDRGYQVTKQSFRQSKNQETLNGAEGS